MDKKKSIAVCMASILSILLFAVIGSSFMAFKYKDEKVVVKNVNIVYPDGVIVTNLNDESINQLEFSEIKLGLKPVTGELDLETKIPVTVTDKNGSEGIYTKFKIKTNSKLNIKIKNLQVVGNEKLEIEKERKNIWLSIKEIDNSTKNFEDSSVTLGSVDVTENSVEYTLLFWLSSVASEDFESSIISFDVIIE